MAKVYGLISGKGGTGKTSSAINIAAALASLEKDAIIVDTNISTPNIGLHLGAAIVPITLNHVLSGKAKITDAIYKHKSNFKIMPSSLSIEELKAIKNEKISDITEQLKQFSEYIILDGAAGLGKETETTINAADEIILITQAEMPAVTDALKAAKLAEQLNKKVKGMIITRYQGKKTEMPIENIIDMLELPLIGIVPEDKNMQKALFLKSPIILSYPRSKASRSYMEIAKKISGYKDKKQGFFSRIFK